MAAGLAAILLAGLRHRAHGLTHYLESLQVESADADPRHAAAIQVMTSALAATLETAERNVRVPDPDRSARTLLDPLIANARRIHWQADLSFSRGHQPQVRPALVSAMDRELRALGVPSSVVA